jgi:oxygen-independent coproporphyrinogen-3 oxidase
MPDFGPFRPPGYPPRSAYLHLPFCHRRCFYCDFPVVPLGDLARGEAPAPGSRSIAAYLGLLHQEIAIAPLGPPLSTVYFGGGTPSLLTPAQIGDLVRALRSRFGLAPGAEVTLELDPASFDRQRLRAYLAGGINRVSLGGQSFDDQVLLGLGRRHRGAEVVEAARWLAEACLDGRLVSWSLDLIQGAPQAGGGGLADWGQQLQQAIALQPPHLSVYDLSIEPGTVFERRQQEGTLALPDQDQGADLMELTWSALAAAGYGHYEISNFAKPGHASRHNRVYWSGAGWWGFGMGATGAPWGERMARPRTREGYAAWLAQELGEGPAGDRSSAETAAVMPPPGVPLDEQLMVGLRRREGVAMEPLLAQQGWGPQEVARQVAQLRQRLAAPLEAGWLVIEGPRWRLSDPQGLAVSNGVLRELLAWWQEQLDGSAPQSSRAGLQPLGPALGSRVG